MNGDTSIRAARSSDFAAARVLLSAAELPVEDLTSDHFSKFLVAENTNALVGLIGLEVYDDVGLLRSLVVAVPCRGLGLGRILVNELEVAAKKQGVTQLWLLTIDADAFFARLGYVVHGRDETPGVIRRTAEFVRLCPGDAVLMQKSIISSDGT